MRKTEKLKMAYNEMKNGKIIEFLGLHTCRCWIGRSNNSNDKKSYIFWRSAGQSAERMSLSNLRWIAKTISKCTTYDYKIVDSVY